MLFEGRFISAQEAYEYGFVQAVYPEAELERETIEYAKRVAVEVAPLDGGTRSRFTLTLDLKGHGIGVLFAMLARRSARKTVPEDQKRLKAILESPGGPGPKPGA